MTLSKIFKNRKVKISLALFLLIGVFPLMFKGLQFGMDFKGGTLIQVSLVKEENTSFDISSVIKVMQSRLNAYGLKDVSVKPYGNEYVIIEIAETDPKVVNQIQSLLGQQGKFEALFEGKVVLTGSDIQSVITDPQQGYGIRGSQGNYEWIVPFRITSQASERIAKEFEGKCSTPQAQTCPEKLYMFIDRPSNAVIVIPTNLANEEAYISETLEKTQEAQSTIPLEELVRESGEELIITNSITDEVIDKVKGKTVIIPEGYYSDNEVALLNSSASKLLVKAKAEDYWIVSALNLENIVHLTPGVTAGVPVTTPSITGHAADYEKANEEMNRVVILLKSGKLPVSVSIASVSTISPVFGTEFVRYSLFAGLLAVLSVGAFITARYRKLVIAFPIMATMLMEVIMILGMAALIGWQLDLAAIAGVIAAVGTGVDHQILITDEVLRGEEDEEVQRSRLGKIKKAFSIIMRSATTTIVALIPLFMIGLGALKGFALTSILGILIGVFITRPTYAAIIKELV